MSVPRPRPSRVPTARDMDDTPFTPILADLLTRVPGAYATALVDMEGETVDYAGLGTPFDMKITAAHLRILLNDIERWGALGTPRWLVIRGAKRTFIGRVLPGQYALIVMLRRRAGFNASRCAFAWCERALCIEAGLPLADPKALRWFPVTVQADRRGRPQHVAGKPVEVLGALVGLAARERGFRVRMEDGLEITLIREARSCWYADEPFSAENSP